MPPLKRPEPLIEDLRGLYTSRPSSAAAVMVALKAVVRRLDNGALNGPASAECFRREVDAAAHEAWRFTRRKKQRPDPVVRRAQRLHKEASTNA